MTPGARIPLGAVGTAALAKRIGDELDRALVPHADKESRLARWDDLYLAKPMQAKKTFPWDGACNVILPLIGTTVDSIVARLVNTIFGVEPFWTVNALHPDFADAAKPTEDFLDWSRRVEFDLYRPVKRWAIEVTKYGWGWLKPRWDVSTMPYVSPTADGSAVRSDIIVRRVVVDHVLCADMIAQADIGDEEQGEWQAHRIRLTDGQIRWRVAEKRFDLTQAEVDAVLRSKDDTTVVAQYLTAADDQVVSSSALNTIYEVWGDFPLGNDPKPVPIRVHFHRPTRTILAAIYNPHFYGDRGFIKGTLIEREGRPEGLGIAQMLEQLQDENATIHQQQVDNATLANTRFFVGKRGQVRSGTKIWPGRVLVVGDPERDLKVMQLGDVYQSMQMLERSVMAYAERRSGVSDPQLGRESQPSSRATATGTLALIQEGNRRFDLNVRDMRHALSKLGKHVLQLNQQFRPRGLAYFVQGEAGRLTEMTLDLPQAYIEHRLGVELTASTATINREVEKQGLIALMQLQQQFGQELLSYAQIVGNPQLPGGLRETAMHVAEARAALMQKVLHAFDQKDAETLIPTLEAMENDALQPSLGGPGIPGNPGAVEPGGPGASPPGAGPVNGLDSGDGTLQGPALPGAVAGAGGWSPA